MVHEELGPEVVNDEPIEWGVPDRVRTTPQELLVDLYFQVKDGNTSVSSANRVIEFYFPPVEK